MIETIVFDEQMHAGDFVESSCGVRHSAQGGKVSIHLFEIAGNKGVPIGDNLFQGCAAIRDRLYPDTKLQDIDWRLTSGVHDTNVRFEEQGAYVTAIHLEHAVPFGGHFKNTVKQYQESLEDPDGFEASQTGGRSFIGGEPLTIYPLLLPDHPDGFVLFKHTKGYEDPDYPKTVVLADSRKLLSLWKSHTDDLGRVLKSFNMSAEDIRKTSWGNGYDAVLLSSPLQDSVEHTDGQSASSMYELPEISYDAAQNKIGFSNGRHRLFNAINAGAAFVPLEMYESEETRLFQEKCGWKAGVTPLSPKRVRAHIPVWE